MIHDFACRRYSLPFRTPVRTAHGVWTRREGLLVRLESEDGRISFGDCAPIPWFGAETAAGAAAACAALGPRVSDEQIDAVPGRFPCLRFALLGARASLPARSHDTRPARASVAGRDARAPDMLPVAALLPAGRGALEKIPALAGAGFRAFKWKVGVAGADEELALLDDVIAALPAGARLRLDANGAWTRRDAERWLARCADYSGVIEFIEQPVAHDAKGCEDLLAGLGAGYSTPIALDESVATAPGIRRWLRLGWRGVFVIKPALLGGAAEVPAALPPERTVFSSALETAVGARDALRVAFRFYAAANTPDPRAAGFGAGPLFCDTRFDAPPAAPFVHVADLDTIEPEILWNALS